MALGIAIIRILLVALAIFLGFFFLPDVARSIDIILLLAVAVIGILSFFSHVVFHKQDAKRLGWQTERPDWQFEVGFANLAIGLVALVAYILSWGLTTKASIVLIYGLYLLQAAILHTIRAIQYHDTNIQHLIMSVFSAIIFSGYLTIFGIIALMK
ncbi:MAG TPA: hypothetical protein ENG70_02030 [Candidatus Cloacimonetes bacterium]|nr:hypothetical protein [Candidatus Cloacimonadota bacterium]HEX37627.1 hypothetical protein [Candidatus Cloacimonadota bacterium]